MRTKTSGPLALLSFFLLVAPVCADEWPADETTSYGAEAKVVWGAAKQTTRRIIVPEMSPLGAIRQPTPRAAGVSGKQYAGYVGLQVLDIVTTNAVLGAGGFEANPIMRLVGAAGPGGMLVKAAATVLAVRSIHKVNKTNPALARATMQSVNAGMANIVVNNLANLR